jgi:general secretion pathway protein C
MNAASWLEGLPASDKWRAVLLTHGPRLATVVLALALAAQAAFIVTDLAGAGKTPAAATPAPPVAEPPRSVNVAAITNAHLFQAAAVAPAQNAANAPQTRMPLVLTGIIAADDPRNGLAILGPTAAAAKVYAVGDSVPGGAKLHSVLSDRVVIDRNGTLESLMLPRQPLSGAAPPPTTAALQTEYPVVERMRRIVTDQPGLLADIMRPQPVLDQGKMHGFRVYPGRNRAAFVRLGLHPGDIVSAINGTPLDDPARSEEIFRTLSTSSEARVTVQRGGHPEEIVLNMSQVAQEAEALAGAQGAAGETAQPPQPPPEPSSSPESAQ